jgi:hypothetical protein
MSLKSKTFFYSSLRSVFVALLISLLAVSACWGESPKVAIFESKSFPRYNVPAILSAREIQRNLNAAGLKVDALNLAALSDPDRLNEQNYAAVILPYGNTYPADAFSNLQAFHRAGGCLIMSGVPFTHPVTAAKNANGTITWTDLGNDSNAALSGENGIGVGSFLNIMQGAATIVPDDPLDLKGIKINWSECNSVQPLDQQSLPAGATVQPVLVQGDLPVAALIKQPNGAVDFWGNHGSLGDTTTDAYLAEQVLERGAVAVLAMKKLITPDEERHAFDVLNAMHPPKGFIDVVLPAVPRPYPTFQPKMPPPARHLYVTDVSKEPSDVKVLLTSLEGLVNRVQPRIFLIFDDQDKFWLEQMIKQGETGSILRVSNPLSLVSKFRSVVKGAVIPDPNVYVSPDIAVDIAGQDNFLIATPKLAAKLHIPIKADLRGRFKNDADALRFARIKLLPKSNRYLSICIDPTLLDTGDVDDIIAAKGTAFWITGIKAQNLPGADMKDEIIEMEKTFSEMPLCAVVRGFWWHGGDMGINEGPGVELGSRFGKVTVVSDYVSNFSVLSGVRIPSLKQKPQPPAPKLDPSKVYVAITVSDGDNLCTWRNYFKQEFLDPLHGTFPIAWGMGPTLLDCAPTIAKWFYDHATPNDEFICDVSGVGYINPIVWGKALKYRSAAYRTFYDWTTKYMKRMDMHTFRQMETTPSEIVRAAMDMPSTRFFMPDYGYAGEKPYDRITFMLPSGQVVFRAMTGGSAAEMADQIRRRVGDIRPAFVNAFITNWGMKLSDLKQVLRNLGPDYVAVTPSQLYTLFREAHGK